MTLGEIVADYRMQHGLSQRKFAQLCGVSNGYISLLEKELNPRTGERLTPTLPLLKKLSTQMGMTVDELMAQADDIEVDLSTDAVAITKYLPSHKEIALAWIRNEATKEERLELAKELLNLL